jgi:hypothetical protein
MTDDAALEQGMTYVEKLDFREQAHRHEMERVRLQELEQTKRAKYQHRTRRQDTVKVVGLSVVAVLAAGMVLAFITYWAMGGPPAPDGLSENERRENACIANGGGWVPDDLLASSSQGICVYPGKSAG